MTEFFKSFTPDPIGVILKTGYNRFEHKYGIDGLAKVDGTRLDLLAIFASRPGKKQFRKFIRDAMSKFEEIYVWEIMNPRMAVILRHYNFKDHQEIVDNREIMNGFRWRKLKVIRDEL